MPDFEVVHRCVIHVAEPYVTETQVRAAVQQVSSNAIGSTQTLPGGISYTVRIANDVAVRKVTL